MSKTLIQFREALSLRLVDVQALGRSRELSLAVTCLQSARMLFGTTAEMLGAPTPYPQADNPASPEILPTADVITPGEASPGLPEDAVAAVKAVRKRLQCLIDDVNWFRRQQWARAYGTEAEAVFDRAYVELLLGKQWLGEQLAVLAGHALVKPADARPAPATVVQRKRVRGVVAEAAPEPPPAPGVEVAQPVTGA